MANRAQQHLVTASNNPPAVHHTYGDLLASKVGPVFSMDRGNVINSINHPQVTIFVGNHPPMVGLWHWVAHIRHDRLTCSFFQSELSKISHGKV